MQLFFSEITDNRVNFSLDEKKHLTKVLRKKVGDELSVIDGKGYLYIVRITSLEKNSFQIEIIRKEKKEKTHNYYLHIAIAPTKNISRFEWFLEKATEIGIDEITPIICQRSERKKINMQRCNRILISSIKQSLKFYKPKLNEPSNFSDFIKEKLEGDKLIAHCLKTEKNKINKSNQKKYIILIGPEGDFTENEITNALKNGFKATTLGNSRLRTETAGIIAAHSVNLQFQ
tara:strand:+ start:4698 stop:5390 length:693 start_codon:yes stop_codon:yes gene_type:complete